MVWEVWNPGQDGEGVWLPADWLKSWCVGGMGERKKKVAKGVVEIIAEVEGPKGGPANGRALDKGTSKGNVDEPACGVRDSNIAKDRAEAGSQLTDALEIGEEQFHLVPDVLPEISTSLQDSGVDEPSPAPTDGPVKPYFPVRIPMEVIMCPHGRMNVAEVSSAKIISQSAFKRLLTLFPELERPTTTLSTADSLCGQCVAGIRTELERSKDHAENAARLAELLKLPSLSAPTWIVGARWLNRMFFSSFAQPSNERPMQSSRKRIQSGVSPNRRHRRTIRLTPRTYCALTASALPTTESSG